MQKLTSSPIPDEQKIGYAKAKEGAGGLGKCPRCGAIVKPGKYGAYCSGKCGMMLSRTRGKLLSDEQVAALLKGQRTHITGLKKKDGGTYSAFFVPVGIEPYSYTANDGTQKHGYRFRFKTEFHKKRT